MKYIYTDISGVKLSFSLSIYSAERLSSILADVESEEHKWFFDSFKETLIEARLKCADELETNAKLIREEAKEAQDV
tara:strand:- start:281 stop:511 length:231 start_codon:yes stop_codon:yes gene_type:complete